jgi:hypothetical protein
MVAKALEHQRLALEQLDRLPVAHTLYSELLERDGSLPFGQVLASQRAGRAPFAQQARRPVAAIDERGAGNGHDGRSLVAALNTHRTRSLIGVIPEAKARKACLVP